MYTNDVTRPSPPATPPSYSSPRSKSPPRACSSWSLVVRLALKMLLAMPFTAKIEGESFTKLLARRKEGAKKEASLPYHREILLVDHVHSHRTYDRYYIYI